MRKLASIQKVVDVRPIPNADKIECVQVLGWEVVVKKNEFKTGDLVVYFEIDSALPISDSRFAFLAERRIKMEDGTEKIERKTKMINGIESAVLTTVKLRKQISQGLVIGLSEFPEITNPIEEMEVTELLKVQKYEFLDVEEVETPKEIPLTLAILRLIDKIPQPMFIRKKLNILRSSFKKKKESGNFPSFIPVTDEDRIQNLYNKLVNRPDAKQMEFEASRKLDGSSATFFLNNSEFGVCSRNIRKTLTNRIIKMKTIPWLPLWLQFGNKKTIVNTDKFCYMAVKYDIEKKLRKLNMNLAIQGEVVGEGIQGNSEKIVGHEFYVFNIFDINQHRYLTPIERMDVFEKLNADEAIKLNHVPIIESRIRVFDKFNSLDEILKFSEGKNSVGNEREGIVYKLISDNGQKLSFKAVSNKYLLGKK